MSGHAETIRDYIRYSHNASDTRDDAYAALDALLAEKQRLREALERIAEPRTAETAVLRELAREALRSEQ